MTATITARITTTWTCPWCTVRAYSIKDLRTHQYVAHRQPCGCLGTKHTPACLSGELAKQKVLIDYVKPSQSLLDIGTRMLDWIAPAARAGPATSAGTPARM